MHAFISYSHADERYLDRLHKHMAMLKRDGLLDAWSDHRILPGSVLGQAIDKQLAASGLFIALVSPDYLDSRYCYETEFQQALALAEADKIRIVPVIVEPCDWKASPFSGLLALPKDGKAIADWTNPNNAYLDVVQGLRRVIEDDAAQSAAAATRPALASSGATRRLKVRQEFDAIQRADFADQSFAVIRDYFRDCCAEINTIDGLKARFEGMSEHAFTCTVVNRGMRQGRGEGHITVRNDKGRQHFRDISYVYEAHASANTSNGSVRVEADEYNLYLTLDSFGGRGEHKYDAKQVAENMWTTFVGQAGIELEDETW